mmetsp:Transcript_50060/g.121289  ORF Transcript_50060/g.121289 Transcript_50060/m.121289 type:complete len:194 (-) Transcript_50060:68-649(-)|eukprot:CAMPEP_0113460994 /NCGR_PEP_ID=MMETSP0014_2-20120614/11294_1 /TAXON_ID=2857 /ORGANISM="Nitzschia sp." /LENGTH=193 /DNA_ID=CAMNT_0000352705 /DNA_START=282 /DNA_END=863 /DNA_ORIENTATION=+ /assembly_acc=CAM_ASM_000159
MFMYLGATTTTTSPKMHMDQTSTTATSNLQSDVEEEFDELGTAILRRGSNPRDNITRSIVVDRNHRKDEELAFCKSMACLLTQTRDLPRLCHSFPTVVRSVGGGGGGEDTSGSSNGMASLDDSSNHSQTITTTTTHLGTSSVSASASSYHPIGFATAGSAGVGSVSFNSDTSDATSTSGSFPYYESIPPHSDR